MTQFKARPTVYKGIKMRSRLEAGFAAWLDQCGFTWEYEPCAFASEEGQYLPDFRIRDLHTSWTESPVTGYVEVKPSSFDDTERLLRQMETIRVSEAEAVCVLQQAPPWGYHSRSYPECTVVWLPDDEPISGLPFPAFRRAHWVRRTARQPMLAFPWFTFDGPWPDGYWKVGG